MKINKILTVIIFTLIVNILFSQLPTPDNYIIFFDFSARIESKDQEYKDTELVKFIVDNYKKGVEKLYKGGKIFATDKITILFYPELEGDNIIPLTSSLNIDFSQATIYNRLEYYKKMFPQNVEPSFITNFKKVYKIALKQNPSYFGSNIYEFFSQDINPYLSEGYNNHVILFTDGYMYMSGENPKRVNKKIGHLEGSILDPLRASMNWKNLYKSQNWGIISSGNKLPDNTDVFVLEVNPDCINNSSYPRTNLRPAKPCPNEFEILTQFWIDWFVDMGISPSKINISKTSNNLNGVKSKLSTIFRN